MADNDDMGAKDAAGVTGSGPVSPVHLLPCQFGRYYLEERLGIGGMAEVFLATLGGDGGFQKRVVVKRILPHLAENPRFVEMFLREANLVARLDHPNIVSVYDFGNEAGAYFLAMEYVEGLTLREIRQRCKAANQLVPIQVAVRAIADAALGLDAVHRQTGDDGKPLGLVHRDISPDNIILSRRGIAKLLDFGIAKAEGEDPLTQTGELKGKIPYMPPEQISGESVDGRTDLYALGASLYAMVCGRRPIHAKTDLLTLSAILKQRPTPPRALRSDIPLALELLLLRLLEKDKDKRPATGREVHDALLRAVPEAALPDIDAIESLLNLAEPAPPPRSSLLPAPSTTPSPRTITVAEAVPPVAAEPGEDLSTAMLVQKMHEGPRHVALLGGLFAGFVVAALSVLAFVIVTDADDDGAQPQLPVVAALSDDPSAPAAMTDPGKPPTASQKPSDDAVEVGRAKTADPKAARKRSRRPSNGNSRTRRRARATPATRTVTVAGPAKLRWVSGGKTVSKGNGAAQVREGSKSLLAVDDARSARILVPIVNGKADFGKVPRGTLSVRVLPFAKVYIGRIFVGETPLSPFSLPAGNYDKIRFVGSSATQTRAIKIDAGTVVKLKVDLTKPK